MKPENVDGSVRAHCPNCNGAITTFEKRDASRDFGTIIKEGSYNIRVHANNRIVYKLLRCAGCGRGGLVAIEDTGKVADGTIIEFYPSSTERHPLPIQTPDGIRKEYEEAELCASNGAYRAASALLRSTLEKALKDSGYTTGSLFDKIDAAASDGVITEPRAQRAHDNVRDLGNDVVHEDWREVTEDEVASSLAYLQRIIEDLYDDRTMVVAKLQAAGRLIV